MKHIGNLLETEYNNAVSLIGIDDQEADAYLSGVLSKLHPVDKQVVTRKLYTSIPSRGSRLEFEKHFIEVPQHIKDQLLAGKLRLADTTIYAVKQLNATVTRMFREQDTMQVSLSNIRNSRLPKNMALLVSGIYLLQGQAASLATEDIMNVKFNPISSIGALTNGQFSFRVNKKHFIVEHGNQTFADTSKNVPMGYFKLDNPRMIADDTEIELEIEIGSLNGIPPNTFLYAGLHGTATIP